MRVNTNVAALNALRNLNRTERDTRNTLERLSSGRKINRAADGPAALVISEQMGAQLTSIQQAMTNSETSISMIQTTEGALNEVSSILINLRQLAVHAANEGANDIKMLQADQSEVDNLLGTLKRIADNTQFGTLSLLDGSNSVNGVAVGDGLEFISATEKTKASSSEGYKVNITQVATRPLVVATRKLELEDAYASFVINEGGKTVALDPKKNRTLNGQIEKLLNTASVTQNSEQKENARNMIQHLVATELQRQADEAGMNIEVFVYKPADSFGELVSNWDPENESLKAIDQYPSLLKDLDSDEVLVIRHKNYGSEPTFTVTTSIEDFFGEDAPSNQAIAALPGRDVEGTIGGFPEVGAGESALGNGQILTGAPGTEAEGLTLRYSNNTDDVVHHVFDRVNRYYAGFFLEEKNNAFLVGDEKPSMGLFSPVIAEIDGYVHLTQNALAFQVGPNEGQQVRLSIDSVNPENLAVNIENESNFRSLVDIDLMTGQGAQDAIKIIDAGVDQVSSMRAKLGAFQKNALETNLNNLRVSHENLSSAQSELVDTDMAAEMSTFVKNQILMESGTAMLAQANQVPKAVLQLLQSNAG
ncbi:MAG: flagellin [SAR324 cluster bacterium]|nr:flagellin [SAR324 cluster bacterium]